MLAGTSSQRLLVAMIRKHVAKDNEHVMVTDHRGRIMYATNKLATFLGFPDSKSIVKTEFANYLAQPYRQLHGGWLKVRSTMASVSEACKFVHSS